MRTTVDLPDPLFRELKSLAAKRGTSLKDVIRHAVEQELRNPGAKPARKVKFPVLLSKDPGVLNLANAEIEDLLT
jgi:hypothetical protein